VSAQQQGFMVLYGTRTTKLYATSPIEAKNKGIAYFRVPEDKHDAVKVQSIPVLREAS